MYGDIYCQHSWRLQIIPRPPCGKSSTDGDSNENVKKAIGLHCNEQNNNFASARRQAVKMPSFMLYGALNYKLKQLQNFLFLPELGQSKTNKLVG